MNLKGFISELSSDTSIEARFDSISKQIYSVDASIYEVKPLAVIVPKSLEELRLSVLLATKYGISITARGAATGITGGCLGAGVIIDTSKYLNKILEIDWFKEIAYVEPGVIQDQLNQALSTQGYRLGPDTSTGDRATLGGMVANNAAGARSLFYGRMVDAVEEVELILSNGKVLSFVPLTEEELAEKLKLPDEEGHIYREVEALKKEYSTEIKKAFPQIPRRVSGYNLDELIKTGFNNFAKLICGSEGTLGVISKIGVRIVKKPLKTALCLIYFQTILEAMADIKAILGFKPMALELIDEKILEAGKKAPSMRGKLDWLKVNHGNILVAEFQGESEQSLKQTVDLFRESMHKAKIGMEVQPIFSKVDMANIWAIRKSGLGLLLSKRSYTRAIAFIEDLSLPPQKLVLFMERFLNYLKSIDKEAGIYGHAGSGCMHIRPFINTRSNAELALAKKMMLDISDLVKEVGGAMSGEHGDGLVRSWMNENFFGPKLYEAFKRLKNAFDPDNLMNPGKIVDGRPFEENLRFNPNRPMKSFETFFSFKKEGGLELAADLCNGNGLCRKKEGVMCPSFQVTGDEYDTTRARATALQGVLQGKLQPESLANKDLLEILDLCIQCKGCKTECPSQVDMAKMKAEILFQYQKKYGYSVRNWLFANLGFLLDWSFPLKGLYNRFKDFKFLKSFLGVANERTLPALAPQKFSEYFATVKQKKGQKVVLFNDTYTEFIQPEIGKAALKVLNALGYEVILLPWKCCGRPHISKGFLKEAKRQAEENFKQFNPFAEQNIPIIGLEPSCILTFTDEYCDLLEGKESESFMKQSILFDTFLHQHLSQGKLPLSFKTQAKTAHVQVHCHQKSSMGAKITLEVLRGVNNCTVHEIPSGCCGMAGSFGYEQEHYTFSMQIANLVLLKTIRSLKSSTSLVANGFSCRTQIFDGCGIKALHLAEFLAENLSVDE